MDKPSSFAIPSGLATCNPCTAFSGSWSEVAPGACCSSKAVFHSLEPSNEHGCATTMGPGHCMTRANRFVRVRGCMGRVTFVCACTNKRVQTGARKHRNLHPGQTLFTCARTKLADVQTKVSNLIHRFVCCLEQLSLRWLKHGLELKECILYKLAKM